MSDVEENEIIINSELLNNDFDDLALSLKLLKAMKIKSPLLNIIIN